MESNNFPVYNEERSFSSPSATRSANIVVNYLEVDASTSAFANPVDPEEYDSAFKNYLNKENAFKPKNGYLDKLQATPLFSAARSKAIHWIIKSRRRLHLRYETAFAAVNYFDRFFSAINVWDMWMAELIAIACLSIACKNEEIYAPNLHEIQSEDAEYAYEPGTITGMELNVLKALKYDLICVTSYSYLDILIHRINSPHPDLRKRTAKFLLRIQLEDKLVHCSAITMAVVALQCSIERLMPFEDEADQHCSTLEQLMPSEHKDKEMCLALIKEHIEAPLFCPMSPVSVLRKRRKTATCISLEIRSP